MSKLDEKLLAKSAEHYGEKGYAVFPSLFDRSEIEPLKRAAAEIVRHRTPR